MRKGNHRPIGTRVYLTALSGILLWALLSVWPMSEMVAQDRPAIARSSGSNKASKGKDPSKKDDKKADKITTKGVDEATGPVVNIGKILPQGRVLQGVKLPSYTGDRLSSLMTAVTMKRLDDKHLDMEKLHITMYAKPGEKDTLISTKRGIYNLEKKEIASDTRTRIEQEGVFDLEGDEMVFDANNQKGNMKGNVKMLLYKADQNLMPSKSKSKSKSKSETDKEKANREEDRI